MPCHSALSAKSKATSKTPEVVALNLSEAQRCLDFN